LQPAVGENGSKAPLTRCIGKDMVLKGKVGRVKKTYTVPAVDKYVPPVEI